MSNEANIIPGTDVTPAPVIDAKEFAVAENEAAASSDSYTHHFNTPFTFENKTYTELTFDWGKLTGEDGLAIEKEMQDLGLPVIVPTFSGEYLVRMASRACVERIGQDAIRAMRLSDFNRIKSRARSFLLKSES